MSWVGLMIGLPLAGLKMLLVDIISVIASTCASIESGRWTAIWSPSKSALNPLQTSGMDPDRVAFDEHRLERLDAHPVQGRGTVEEDGMVLDDLLEDIPNLFDLPFEHLLGRLDRVGVAELAKPADDERLEQLERDLLGQAALVEPEVGADHDHRPGPSSRPRLPSRFSRNRPLLALDHVGQGLERAVARPQDRPLAAVIVEEGIDGLLEHPLLVADDDLGRIQVDQLLEPVVAVDDPAVEVVEVAGGEITAIEEHERPEIGRDDRIALEDHPLGPVVGVTERSRRP